MARLILGCIMLARSINHQVHDPPQGKVRHRSLRTSSPGSRFRETASGARPSSPCPPTPNARFLRRTEDMPFTLRQAADILRETGWDPAPLPLVWSPQMARCAALRGRAGYPGRLAPGHDGNNSETTPSGHPTRFRERWGRRRCSKVDRHDSLESGDPVYPDA
jgi:hypothetical protein